MGVGQFVQNWISGMFNLIHTLADAVAVVGVLGNALILFSPRLKGRISAWWTSRKSLAGQLVPQPGASGPYAQAYWQPQPGMAPPATAPDAPQPGLPQQGQQGAWPAPPPYAQPGSGRPAGQPGNVAPRMPYPPQAPNTGYASPGYAPGGRPIYPPPPQYPPAAQPGRMPSQPGMPGAYQPYPVRRAAWRPHYPGLSAAIGVTSLLLLAGYVCFAAGNYDDPGISGTIFSIGTGIVFCGYLAAIAIAIITASIAIRLGKPGWTVGVILGTVGTSLILFPTLASLIFTLFGPPDPDPAPRGSYPRLAWICGVDTVLVLFVFFLAVTFNTVPADAPLWNVLGLLAVLGYLVGIGMTIWALVRSVVLWRWGWLIASLVLGLVGMVFLPCLAGLVFALTGPRARRAPPAPQPQLVGVAPGNQAQWPPHGM